MAELTDERAAFEAAISAQGYDISRDERNGGRDYARPATRAAWDGYRLALSATGAEDAEPVGVLSVSKFRGHLENYSFDYTGSLPDGTYRLYAARTQSNGAAGGGEVSQ